MASDQPIFEPQPIKYVVSPDMSPQIVQKSIFLPVVGNARVYNNIAGEFDRAILTNLNTPKTTYTLPVHPGFYGLQSGLNALQSNTGSDLRTGVLHKERSTSRYNGAKPGYVFGDVSVDPALVQNGGQYNIPEPIKRDLLGYRTSFVSGGNIIWPLGPRDGIPTRVMERNISNLCQ